MEARNRELGEWEPQRVRREGERRKGKGERKKEPERGTKKEGFDIVFAIFNPFVIKREISHITMHCVVPFSEANCFCKLCCERGTQMKVMGGV